MNRFEKNIEHLKVMLANTTIKGLNSQNITSESLHDALLYLTNRRLKTMSTRSQAELRRCIADTLLLLDGFDMKNRTPAQNNDEA